MIHYVDGGFLLTLLVLTDGSRFAKEALSEATLPLPMTALHRLQAANLIQQMKTSPNHDRKGKARTAEQLWIWYFAEGVFIAENIDWNQAFDHAVESTLNDVRAVPPLITLHVSIAVLLGATHFFSFDSRSRALAQSAGMAIRPATL